LKQRKKKSTKRPKFDHHESQQAAFAETRISERNSTNSYCAHDATELPLLYGCRFAAQVFHGLYDEVMITSARGHGLMLRVQQLEAELPLLEKDSCQRDYLYVASNRGGFSIKCKFLFCCLSFTTSQFSEKKTRSVCFFPSFVKAIIKSLLQVSIGIQIQGWTMGLSQEVTRLASSWIQSSGVADHPNSSCLTSMMTYLYRVATEDLNHDGCSIVQRAGMISVARGRA